VTFDRLTAQALVVALDDLDEAERLVARYERSRLTHVPAYAGACAMRDACSAKVERLRARLTSRPPVRLSA
jgi:hypothetical protein